MSSALTAKNAPQFPLEIDSVDGGSESPSASTSTRQVVTSDLVAFRTYKLKTIRKLLALFDFKRDLRLATDTPFESW